MGLSHSKHFNLSQRPITQRLVSKNASSSKTITAQRAFPRYFCSGQACSDEPGCDYGLGRMGSVVNKNINYQSDLFYCPG